MLLKKTLDDCETVPEGGKTGNNDLEVKLPNVFVARQPILSRQQDVFAYELLFRSGFHASFDPLANGEHATARVIANSFYTLGIEKVAKGKKAFINFTEELLHSEYPLLCDRETTVIEVLENVTPSAAIVERCSKLVEHGFTLALDDFVYSPAHDPLLSLATIVKFDILQHDRQQLQEQMHHVKHFNVKLLAEKVETRDDFEFTKELGFHFFQGFFFSKPSIVSGYEIPSSKLHLLRLLQMLSDENFDFSQIAEILGQDVTLSFKLLKFVNSAMFALRNKIESLQSAIGMLGEKNLRRWLSLISLSTLATDKPSELLKMAIIRGYFCEHVGMLHPELRKNPPTLYTIGLFSLLDALLDQPMEKILAQISLNDSIKNALLGKNMDLYGAPLVLLRAYEHGNWKAVSRIAERLHIDPNLLPGIFEQAIGQAEQFGTAL